LLYLLDANVLITAHNTYYPIDRVPEFWSWLQHQGVLGHIKIAIEIMEEILAGHDDALLDWLKNDANQGALRFHERVRPDLVRRVVYEGYAADLTDDEVEKLGRDPFLISYGLAAIERCIVTTEVSRPSKFRQNRKIPDVCSTLKLDCCGPFDLNHRQGFHTGWKP
jgi:hypothetical protein